MAKKLVLSEQESRLLQLLNTICERDCLDQLDVDVLRQDLGLPSRQDTRRLCDRLLALDRVEICLEGGGGYFALRLTTQGKITFDKAMQNHDNELMREQLLARLANAYAQNQHTDSDALAATLGVHWNKACLNLRILERQGQVTLTEQYGSGHLFYSADLTPQGKMTHDYPPRRILFVSHAAIDSPIALYLKEVLEELFPRAEVFVSSDQDDVSFGVAWAEKVLDALRDAQLVLVLATDRGLSRKWVWYEAGACWSKTGSICSCCLGELRKQTLPPPFSLFQAVNIDDLDGLAVLLDTVGSVFGTPTRDVNGQEITTSLCRLDAQCAALLAQEG